MQINWHYHSNNFDEIAELFDLNINVEYAASLLKQLYNSHGSWQKAVQHYHSARPEYNGKYGRKVLTAWLKN
jgi:soluble lytic murein transglycosylase-like protein